MPRGASKARPRRSSARCLYAPEMHDPEVIIRTSGEQRLSNYLLWQSAYAELVFRDELWPDFTREALEESLRSSPTATAASGALRWDASTLQRPSTPAIGRLQNARRSTARGPRGPGARACKRPLLEHRRADRARRAAPLAAARAGDRRPRAARARARRSCTARASTRRPPRCSRRSPHGRTARCGGGDRRAGAAVRLPRRAHRAALGRSAGRRRAAVRGLGDAVSERSRVSPDGSHDDLPAGTMFRGRQLPAGAVELRQ